MDGLACRQLLGAVSYENENLGKWNRDCQGFYKETEYRVDFRNCNPQKKKAGLFAVVLQLQSDMMLELGENCVHTCERQRFIFLNPKSSLVILSLNMPAKRPIQTHLLVRKKTKLPMVVYIVTPAHSSSRAILFLIRLLPQCSFEHSTLSSPSKAWLLKSRGHSGWGALARRWSKSRWRSQTWRWRWGKALLRRGIETWRQKPLRATVTSLRRWWPRRQA